MKPRAVLITIAALFAIGLTSFIAYRYEQARETAGLCPFCERTVHPVTTYRLKFNGHEIRACCPRCGMHAQLNQGDGQKVAAWATDVNSGQGIAAESATYVEGGDVQYCTHGDQSVAREPGGVSTRKYDRCLPTLVAFKTPQEAEGYRLRHGGRVLSYTQALASVQRQ